MVVSPPPNHPLHNTHIHTHQPTAVQQIPIPIYAPLQGQPQHQPQLGLSTGPPVSQPQDLFSSSMPPYRYSCPSYCCRQTDFILYTVHTHYITRAHIITLF